MPASKISLSGSRSLIATYSIATSPTRTWLVFLQESGADYQNATRRELSRLLGSSLAKQFNYLVINKPGVHPDGKDTKEFERSFRRQLRIQDALITMTEVIPEDHEIFLVGYSEGAYLAPQIAKKEQRVRGIVMIGGGTRGWLKEELSNASPREKRSLQKVIRLIHNNPRSNKIWNEFTYATWHSYRGDHTLNALRQLNLPVLAILGGRDRTIDLKATREDLANLMKKRPIKLKILANCGHSFISHWPEAWIEVRRFLTSVSF